MPKTETELREEFDRYARRESWGAWLIVAALVAEAYSVWQFHTPDKSLVEAIFLAIANLAIAAGVYAEIHFGRKAHDAGASLQQMSDERVATLEAQAAEANRAASEARFELARFRAPRRALMTSANVASLTRKLTPFSSTRFDSCLNGNSAEQADFWWDLQPALVRAGWVHIAWGTEAPDGEMGLGGLVFVQGDRPSSGSCAAKNVEIHLLPSEREGLLAAAEALVSALNDIGVEAAEVTFNANANTPNAIHIAIGDKQ
jgi:hypothetical protein